MSSRNLFLIALIFVIAASCNSTGDKKNEPTANPREMPLPTTGEPMSKEQQLNVLISESKRTLDSIDAAYKNIAMERQNAHSLDMYEKEQVNEALMELNDAKDLIVLETQQKVINELKEKSASLQGVMQKMNTASAKCKNITQTIARVSAIIEQTTNILASALTSGIIRPQMPPTTTTTKPTVTSTSSKS